MFSSSKYLFICSHQCDLQTRPEKQFSQASITIFILSFEPTEQCWFHVYTLVVEWKRIVFSWLLNKCIHILCSHQLTIPHIQCVYGSKHALGHEEVSLLWDFKWIHGEMLVIMTWDNDFLTQSTFTFAHHSSNKLRVLSRKMYMQDTLCNFDYHPCHPPLIQ